jgi:coenzyme A diphosphatase NUDT7
VVLITDQTLRPILNDAEVTTLFSHPLAGFLTEEPLRHSTTVSAPYAPDPMRSIDPLTQMNLEDLQIGAGLHPQSMSTDLGPTLLDVARLPALTTAVAAEPGQQRPAPTRYHTYLDIDGEGNSPMRMHAFLTGREGEGVKPVYGLTSAILIHAALVAFAPRKAQFDVRAPGQLPNSVRIANAVCLVTAQRRTCSCVLECR